MLAFILLTMLSNFLCFFFLLFLQSGCCVIFIVRVFYILLYFVPYSISLYRFRPFVVFHLFLQKNCDFGPFLPKTVFLLFYYLSNFLFVNSFSYFLFIGKFALFPPICPAFLSRSWFSFEFLISLVFFQIFLLDFLPFQKSLVFVLHLFFLFISLPSCEYIPLFSISFICFLYSFFFFFFVFFFFLF